MLMGCRVKYIVVFVCCKKWNWLTQFQYANYFTSTVVCIRSNREIVKHNLLRNSFLKDLIVTNEIFFTTSICLKKLFWEYSWQKKLYEIGLGQLSEILNSHEDFTLRSTFAANNSNSLEFPFDLIKWCFILNIWIHCSFFYNGMIEIYDWYILELLVVKYISLVIKNQAVTSNEPRIKLCSRIFETSLIDVHCRVLNQCLFWVDRFLIISFKGERPFCIIQLPYFTKGITNLSK